MMGHRSCLVALVLAACVAGCDKKEDKATAEPAPPAASAATGAATPGAAAHGTPAAAASGNTPAPSGAALKASRGKMTFLIDAPLEKIKGQAEDVQGTISLDPSDLSKTRGELGFKMATLTTTTFGKAKDDAAQSEHARNWMQVGPESAEADKARYAWSKFTVRSVEATPGKLADAREENGVRTVKGKVTGDLEVHGVKSPKTFAFTATIKGPVDAPTEVTIKSDAPFDLSMKEHQIMPRDKIGGLLSGALDKIGKKIDDKVQVSLELTATK
jgi:polyisoprenoid-binding protein YceI